MDVVPDGKDFLSEFVESLADEELSSETQSNKWSEEGKAKTETTTRVEQTDVWADIEEALHRWTSQILDAESRREKTASFRESIEASLQRQQLDGFLSHQDITELRYIAGLWTNLLNSTSSYTIGCDFVKRDIITYLLELYNLRQISDCLFIETCLKL